MYILVSAASFILLVFALVDIITRQEWEVQHLPKVAWVLLVVFLPLLGSILWFVVGRAHGSAAPRLRATRPSSHGERWRQHDDLRSAREDYSARRVQTTEGELAALEREIAYYEAQARLKRAKDAAGGDAAIE
jgi:Phospholipase_D-nuclease N-terminal